MYFKMVRIMHSNCKKKQNKQIKWYLESEAGDILSFFLLSKNENMKKNIEYHENTKTKRRELRN